jgi:Insect cuticle protein
VNFSKNRQFKLEEKDEFGDVYGQYGFYDDKGKLRVVKYTSPADGGFKVL